MATRSKLKCFICQSGDTTVECINCKGPFCQKCDDKFHSHPAHPQRHKHRRKALSNFIQCNCCGSENVHFFCITCEQQNFFCRPCDDLFHSHQGRQGHVRKAVTPEKDARIQELENIVQSIQERHQIEKGEITLERNTSIQMLENIVQSAQERHQIEKEEITLERNTSIQELENIVQSTRERHQMEKDAITHKQNARLQELENTVQSIQERLRIEKVVLENKNRSLESQISILKKAALDNEEVLQQYKFHNKEATWKTYSNGSVPIGAVISNVEPKCYVGRIKVDGDVVPGNIWPRNKVCYVYHNGQKHNKSSYEVLVPSLMMKWIPCIQNRIPPNAVPGGRTNGGEVLYVGRIEGTNGWYYVGKVQPSIKGCYNRPEVNEECTVHPNYDILVWI